MSRADPWDDPGWKAYAQHARDTWWSRSWRRPVAEEADRAARLGSFIRALADEDERTFGVPVPLILADEARRLIRLRWDPVVDPSHGGPGHVGMYEGFVMVLAREQAPDTTPDSEFSAPPAIRDEARKLLRILRGEQDG